ncbi:MAG: hydroxymethylglutaryl-CoA lyase [Proteobacteria bacterium]|jgi:hydroxymethylglutaryl-CoA lyase|nr:hydroxymethylglutaryl-CoA lyase [Pseudomonadota bacterium]
MGSRSIRIVEVGLRDGLQNEKQVVPTAIKVGLAQRLKNAGVKTLEIGAFVRADKVPQMADTKLFLGELSKTKDFKLVQLSALVPNEKGMHEAIAAGLKEVAVFTAASDSFTRNNINCTVEESFVRFEPVFKLAKKNKIKVRGYLSTAFGCPYEGSVSEKRVVDLTARLLKLGCYEVSIGDTIGVAVPSQVESLVKKIKARKISLAKIAGHFHDTRGTSLANILTAYRLGLRVFDSSLGGLGGCPYAPGASGNVATEDVVYMFEKMNVKTGLHLKSLIDTNHWLSQTMKRSLPSKVSQAGSLLLS